MIGISPLRQFIILTLLLFLFSRGSHSLETICLLLALKIEFPKQVHLIRGNHEAHDINALFGFRLECLERLGDDQVRQRAGGQGRGRG